MARLVHYGRSLIAIQGPWLTSCGARIQHDYCTFDAEKVTCRRCLEQIAQEVEEALGASPKDAKVHLVCSTSYASAFGYSLSIYCRTTSFSQDQLFNHTWGDPRWFTGNAEKVTCTTCRKALPMGSRTLPAWCADYEVK